jgi:hypothetical protein
MIILAAVLSAVLAAPAPAAVGFDQGVQVGPILESLHKAPQARPVSAAQNMWDTRDVKTVTLKPGQTQSDYVEMTAVIYHDVCTTPSPWTGPICHPEPMFTDARRFKLVLSSPIPASWGPVTFRLELTAIGRPDLTIKADGPHKFTYQIPDWLHDVLTVTPVAGS